MAYLPSFIGCFGGNVDPSIVGEVWRTVALETSLRGEHPIVILLAALRVLNTLFPSMQRAVIIKTLEKYSLSEKTLEDLFNLNEKHPAEMLIIDWFSMAEGLIQEIGRVPHFSTAEEFLHSAKYIAPRSTVLVYSHLAELSAMRMWQNAGLGECFYRIAGRERGKPGEYPFLQALSVRAWLLLVHRQLCFVLLSLLAFAFIQSLQGWKKMHGRYWLNIGFQLIFVVKHGKSI